MCLYIPKIYSTFDMQARFYIHKRHILNILAADVNKKSGVFSFVDSDYCEWLSGFLKMRGGGKVYDCVWGAKVGMSVFPSCTVKFH